MVHGSQLISNLVLYGDILNSAYNTEDCHGLRRMPYGAFGPPKEIDGFCSGKIEIAAAARP